MDTPTGLSQIFLRFDHTAFEHRFSRIIHRDTKKAGSDTWGQLFWRFYLFTH